MQYKLELYFYSYLHMKLNNEDFLIRYNIVEYKSHAIKNEILICMENKFLKIWAETNVFNSYV